jgi:Sulfotransferase family
MHEFETFVFLDVQKTGSTFVSHLLTEFCTEEVMKYKKHKRVEERYDPKKFYFITVRNPLDQYISLYSHGCAGMGGLSRRLRKRGHGDLYDSTWSGFRKWLKFVLKPEVSDMLDDEYGDDANQHVRDLIGFQTYRYLELALRTPIETLAACKTQDDVRAAHKETNIANFVVHHETFADDLVELFTTKLRHAIRDIDGAIKHIREAPKLNTSDRIDAFEPDPTLGNKIQAQLDEREWLLHELFEY